MGYDEDIANAGIRRVAEKLGKIDEKLERIAVALTRIAGKIAPPCGKLYFGEGSSHGENRCVEPEGHYGPHRAR